MNRKLYSSAIKKTPFKYPIAKKIAKLMLDGMDREEIYTDCFDNNYIEIESPDRRREITNVVYGRLAALDPFLLEQFYNGDVATSKFILAYAIAKTDTNHEIVGRFGGDEFIILIKNSNDLDSARKTAEGLVEGVSNSVILPNND